VWEPGLAPVCSCVAAKTPRKTFHFDSVFEHGLWDLFGPRGHLLLVSGTLAGIMPRLIALENLQQFAAVNLTLDPGAIGGPKVIPNAAEITLAWALDGGKTGHNVLIGRYSGGFAGTQAQCNAILQGLTTGAQWTALAAHLAPATALAIVTIRDLNTAGQPIIASSVAGASGTSSGTPLPNEVSAVITLRTAFTGPQNRGRVFVPGWATTALGTGNVIAAPAVTALGNWGTIIAGVLNAQGYLFSVGHVARAAYTGSTGTQHPARPAGTVPVVSVAVRDNHWDSQRRRGLK